MSSLAPNNNGPEQPDGNYNLNFKDSNDGVSPNSRKRRRSDGGESSDANHDDDDNISSNSASPSDEQTIDSHNPNEGGSTSVNAEESINIVETRNINEPVPASDIEPDFDLNNAFNEQRSSTNELVTVPDSSVDTTTENNTTISVRLSNEPINLMTQDTEPNVISEEYTNPTVNTTDASNNHNSMASEEVVISSVRNVTPTLIDVEAAEQRVVEISDEELEKEIESKTASEYKAARDYQCPICFDPPETALITRCGHVFCCECLFHMVNSSRTNRASGHCALCRSNVRFNDVKLVIMRKKRVKKN
ncbi:similar to Saccharomyces cerevisiae YER116C SLX8 Subunit of the Slx5-Slx8 SUMO-targeted ubiquitin ligase (STUbL) complex [Maudiozyma barnettii]|mgnify:CR=1 FL=1|uniref:Similar to Saccharomyces cerevisiae YER116C SLX8 Subunit of the Slx5-Slx8 SUMO-targeted ubiquitin ligase (STUbL) complex n=1 Tax=Maudiozyma barnettii TaxID=61262 RepID=A0A8H2VBD9_9SACH|nr:SUMO-targeted ubiquitin ligase complex subunit SLX8 [Kazachstania barnettii]CAB4252153.1 similar to Saccharomyces cerevisiae YER116C SLX8 Subunit of the Slx5-Slx8 SUMO-targeted ubiquitin ligase (STUbL) complex [Kazachstania barnettii]CAD1778723.1 similar to Saccharomyces cerevisiae YER116C SLX8 Subunit of the Slx5-Slx8 SUMO-targeted ubiquitin ligase (STUbL) complex [Kazachstania barnettii]